jgi:hypothetical protein
MKKGTLVFVVGRNMIAKYLGKYPMQRKGTVAISPVGANYYEVVKTKQIRPYGTQTFKGKTYRFIKNPILE